MDPKTCDDCGSEKPFEEFLATKKRRESSLCNACRKRRAARHRKNYYRNLPPDKRHTLTHKRRAEAAGVRHVEYSREAIAARWRDKCAYCDGPFQHLDHVTPISRGGEDVESNMVPACAACNLSKGALTLAEWALRDFPPPF